MCVKKIITKEDLKLTRYHQKPWGQKYEGKDKRKKTVYAKPRGAGHMHRLLVYNKKRTRKRTKKKTYASRQICIVSGEKKKKGNKYFQSSTKFTTRRRRSVPPWATHGPVGVRFPYFFPLDGRSPVYHPTCEVPFPPRRSGEYWKGMIPARPLYQGGCGSVWDPEPSKERVRDWGGPATVWSLFCVAETRATRPNGEWGYGTRRLCWATSAQRRCHRKEALY